MIMINKQAQWKKIVYDEGNGSVVVRQGYYSEEGDFVRVVGDKTNSLIRKDKVISITSRQAGGINGRR